MVTREKKYKLNLFYDLSHWRVAVIFHQICQVIFLDPAQYHKPQIYVMRLFSLQLSLWTPSILDFTNSSCSVQFCLGSTRQYPDRSRRTLHSKVFFVSHGLLSSLIYEWIQAQTLECFCSYFRFSSLHETVLQILPVVDHRGPPAFVPGDESLCRSLSAALGPVQVWVCSLFMKWCFSASACLWVMFALWLLCLVRPRFMFQPLWGSRVSGIVIFWRSRAEKFGKLRPTFTPKQPTSSPRPTIPHDFRLWIEKRPI